ncbi:hypothetical protein AVEN_137594-1 [Araneus ventricosus]|uniref:Uncharacterized protein n=1 Tax=Araneus ventricosus TaxID=182803 RepID=A0A4Y2CTM2_ARAVE|nr:hypothetical protein AVEN_137594-1 [Araneus ventricosus]
MEGLTNAKLADIRRAYGTSGCNGGATVHPKGVWRPTRCFELLELPLACYMKYNGKRVPARGCCDSCVHIRLRPDHKITHQCSFDVCPQASEEVATLYMLSSIVRFGEI